MATHVLVPPNQQSIRERLELEKKAFRKSIQKSLLIHAILLLIIFLSTVVFHKKPIFLQSSVRVDLIGLPDIKKSDLTKAQPTDDPKDINKKFDEIESKSKSALEKIKKEVIAKEKQVADEMALKKKEEAKKNSLKNAIDRIKSIQNIEESLNKTDSKPAKVLAKGNALSKGSSLIGDPSDSFNEYADKMKARLNENWNLPIWLSKQNLSVKVVINLDSKGQVVSTIFIKPSGNKQFDGYVQRTIQLSQPFGPPPQEIIDNGVSLGFPL